MYSSKYSSEIPPPLIKPLKCFWIFSNYRCSGGIMELHPLLSQLDNTDLEQYMNECKGKLLDFLEELGLSNALALHLLDGVWAYVLRNNSFLFLEYADDQVFPGTGLN
jgi:hypothetical protein